MSVPKDTYLALAACSKAEACKRDGILTLVAIGTLRSAENLTGSEGTGSECRAVPNAVLAQIIAVVTGVAQFEMEEEFPIKLSAFPKV